MEAWLQAQPPEIQADIYAAADSALFTEYSDGHGRSYNTSIGVKAHQCRSSTASSSSSTARTNRKSRDEELKEMEDRITKNLEAKYEERWNRDLDMAVSRRMQTMFGSGYAYPPPAAPGYPLSYPPPYHPAYTSASTPPAFPPSFPVASTPAGFSQEYFERHGMSWQSHLFRPGTPAGYAPMSSTDPYMTLTTPSGDYRPDMSTIPRQDDHEEGDDVDADGLGDA